MDESKMYQVQRDVACEHAENHTEERIHMPVLFKSKTAKKRFFRFITKVAILIALSALSLWAAWIVSLWAVPAPYRYRGYQAYGGEWILIACTFLATFFGARKLIKTIRKKVRTRGWNGLRVGKPKTKSIS